MKHRYPILQVSMWLMLVLIGCTPTQTQRLATAWGDVSPITSAPWIDAPSVSTLSDGWLGWTTYQEGAVRLIGSPVRTVKPTILAIDAWNPLDLAIFPASDQKTHWVWRDRKSPDEASFYLKFALVNQTLVAELGANLLSPNPVMRYSAVPQSNGGLRVVWVEGKLGSYTLYTATIDGNGRATLPIKLLSNADYPALVEGNDGTVWVFWLADHYLWRAKLVDNALNNGQRLTNEPKLGDGEWLQALHIAMDEFRTYAFWQVVSVNQRAKTWFASGADASDTWTNAQTLGITFGSGQIQTGFNSGTVAQSSSGNNAVEWAEPLNGQFPIVPLVGTIGQRLVIIYFKNGEPIGVQSLSTVGNFFSAPHIATDNDRHLMVTWSQSNTSEMADLYVISTRR